MQLHRAGNAPDWQKIPEDQWNPFQRFAARTRGVVTPANFITLIGLGLVLYGGLAVFQHHYWLGLACIVLGRLADILDGWVADRTGTKNTLGEFLDAAVDKVATLALLGLFIWAHVAAWWVLGLMILPHIIIGLYSGAIWVSGRRLHPSRIGKYTMAAVWVCMGAFVLLQALGHGHGIAMVVFDIVALVIAVVGFYVAGRYIQTGPAK